MVRVAPHVRGSAQVVYGNKNWHPPFTGTTPDYLHIMNWGVESGSNFTDDDMLLNRKVALIGQTVGKELFSDDYPIGQTIRVKHIPFEVVGVLKERGTSSWSGDLDDTVIVPLRTAQRKLLGIRYVRGIEVSAESRQATSDVQDGITALLRVRHKITGTKLDDFRVRNRTDILEAANEAASTLGYLLAGIAGVALIVGGIGIMNIMLVSVTERTREIGVRLAIGARRRDIRRQFLTEAMVLSLLGGAVGILAGAAASWGSPTWAAGRSLSRPARSCWPSPSPPPSACSSASSPPTGPRGSTPSKHCATSRLSGSSYASGGLNPGMGDAERFRGLHPGPPCPHAAGLAFQSTSRSSLLDSNRSMKGAMEQSARDIRSPVSQGRSARASSTSSRISPSRASA